MNSRSGTYRVFFENECVGKVDISDNYLKSCQEEALKNSDIVAIKKLVTTRIGMDYPDKKSISRTDKTVDFENKAVMYKFHRNKTYRCQYYTFFIHMLIGFCNGMLMQYMIDNMIPNNK